MTAKHRPGRIEEIRLDLVQVDCSCGYEAEVKNWSVALKVLTAHVNEANREQQERVANELFHVVHPDAGHYKNQPHSVALRFEVLAEHVLEKGYTE